MGKPMAPEFQTATAVNFTWCADPECDAVHVVLLDETGMVFAQAVIPPEMIHEMVKYMQKGKAPQTGHLQ